MLTPGRRTGRPQPTPGRQPGRRTDEQIPTSQTAERCAAKRLRSRPASGRKGRRPYGPPGCERISKARPGPEARANPAGTNGHRTTAEPHRHRQTTEPQPELAGANRQPKHGRSSEAWRTAERQANGRTGRRRVNERKDGRADGRPGAGWAGSAVGGRVDGRTRAADGWTSDQGRVEPDQRVVGKARTRKGAGRAWLHPVAKRRTAMRTHEGPIGQSASRSAGNGAQFRGDDKVIRSRPGPCPYGPCAWRSGGRP
jgi:hypothetical protein